ncbi:DHA2 family efflux MFS transporter permease subunit [Ktedonobacter robiniae]|uniref:MFS transporter n=1 Tax=Ktedonobacter robiniae TaxID=2778365 RepID=A0ABQ3V4A4_9CHLR|nr:DHA2 family efflux MFS transporter permease subunit [Ktedonobacter robiniae]GHO60006.1 MFS transporter [Ktedonobacter robiniae]
MQATQTPRSFRLALIILCTGFFMTTLDMTIVTVAIPNMLTTMHSTLDQILWVVNAYMLVYGALLITGGRLGDIFGSRTIFACGLGIFVVASTLCGLSQNSLELIAARVLQGVGSALITSTSLALLTSLYPPERRGAALGTYAGVAGLASVVGPLAGGIIVSLLSWRWIFFINVPIGIIALVATFLLIPELRTGKTHQIDFIGIILATAGLFSIIFALDEGQTYHWGTITGILSIPSLLIAGVVILLAFIVWERVPQEPLLPLALFKNHTFSSMAAVNLSLAFGQLGFIFLVNLFFESSLGMSALIAGLATAPLMLAIMIASPLAGRLSDKIGGKYILIAGLVFFAAGISLTAWLSTLHPPIYAFLLPLVLAGVGIGCAASTLMGEAMRGITPPLMGAASGLISTTRQVGGAIGGAVVGGFLQYRLASTHTTIVSGITTAVLPSFLIIAAVLLAGALLCLTLKRTVTNANKAPLQKTVSTTSSAS